MPDVTPIVLQQIDLDIVPGKTPPIVHVSEYDTGRQILVNLFRDGYPFGTNSIESYDVKVEGSIGKYGFSEDASWASDAEGVVAISLTEAMTAVHGRVWTKIKLIKSENMQISTCGFWLDCDRAGVEADTVIGAPGFQEQINEGVAEYFDNDPPFFELPEGGQEGQALLSDGSDGAVWGEAGIPEAVKTALLNVVAHIGAWSDNKGQDYYDALYESLYNAAPVPSRLPAEYQEVEWIGSSGTQLLLVGLSLSGSTPEAFEMEAEIAVPELNASTAILMGMNSEGGFYISNVQNGSAVGLGPSIVFSNLNVTQKHKYVLTWDATNGIATCEGQTIQRARSALQTTNFSFFGDYEKLFLSKCRIYSAKVKQSGVYVRDLVPCYRKSDNVIGMYDVVENAFYINTGTGTFTKGANV